MAYNPYSAVNAIYGLKGKWNDANGVNDEAGKNSAASKAQSYYAQLRQNGYGDVADELAAADYTKAKNIRDKWAKMGKTSTRDYMYSSGKSKGLTSSDVDNLIGWDNQTGEVSFGGKKIGKPETIVDGVSYWSDTAPLDTAFNDYISRSGTVRSKELSVNQENENLFQKYNREYDDLKSTNPFETAEAKSILDKYDLAGLQGRDNAVADTAGSNGGNIDSFAAANALRQQASLVNQGQQAVLQAYQQKLDHARGLLSDMGVNIDRVYNQDETTKNNDVARKTQVSEVTGYVPEEWTVKNDAFLKNFVDESGKLKSEYNNTDFQALANKAKTEGNTELAKKYAILRGLKIFGNFDKYGQYLKEGDIGYTTPQKTANYNLNEKQADLTEKTGRASVTGYVPNEWAIKDDAFLKNFVDETGKLKSAYSNTDFQALANKAKAEGNTELAKKYAILRGLKIFGDFDKYGQYLNEGDIGYIEPQRTADYDLTKQQIDSAERISKDTNSASAAAAAAQAQGAENAAAIEAQNKLDIANIDAQNKLDVAQIEAQNALDQIAAKANTKDETAVGTNKSTKAPLTESQVKSWVTYLNEALANKFADEKYNGYQPVAVKEVGKNQYELGNVDSAYVIMRVLKSNDLTDKQKQYLLFDKFGLSEDQVNETIRDKHYK